jgi:hypothetical protein
MVIVGAQPRLRRAGSLTGLKTRHYNGTLALPAGSGQALLRRVNSPLHGRQPEGRRYVRQKQIPLYATRRTQTVRKKKPGRSARNDSVSGAVLYVGPKGPTP